MSVRTVDAQSTILIVDDFPTMRQIIRNFLRELGYRNIEEATDGAAALKKVESSDIDLVITDWKMPVMEGLQLLQSIRADQHHADLPVIMIAAEARQDQISAAAKHGVSGYIVKPFTADTLAKKIGSIVRALASTS